MIRLLNNCLPAGIFLMFALFLIFGVPETHADLYLNILAVNGTEHKKEKEIEFYLPRELASEDIVDTAGLKLEYDVNEGAYFVTGKVVLEPKETKVYKVLLKDIWRINDEEIDDIKGQIDMGFQRLENTDYYETGKIKKESLLGRLEFIVQEQKKHADDIEARIDLYRVYKKEISAVREKSLSVKYWRAKPPKAEELGIFVYIVQVENPTDLPLSIDDKKYYLPPEVLPEHIVGLQEFEMKYDVVKGQSYLVKKEELKPQETKRYEIGIIDVWNIDEVAIENLRVRAGHAFKLIEPTEYLETANYLMSSIKDHLEKIEESQNIEKNITEHISSYRGNLQDYQDANEDVEALESLLEAVRENLERSKVKNVLKRIRSLKFIAEIAASMFKKPSINKAWKIIIGIIIFVGIYTFLHFTFWGGKSRQTKNKEERRNAERKV